MLCLRQMWKNTHPFHRENKDFCKPTLPTPSQELNYIYYFKLKTSQFQGGSVIFVSKPIKTDVEMPKSFFSSVFCVTRSPEFYHMNRIVSFEIIFFSLRYFS